MNSTYKQNRIFFLIKVVLVITLFSIFLFYQKAKAESNPPGEATTPSPKSLLLDLHYGIPFHLWSDHLYWNFQIATLSLTYEKEWGLWPFTKNKDLVKSFLLEFRLTRIWGKDIPLSDDQVSQETLAKAHQEGRNPTVDWDHYQIGLTPYLRFYYPLAKKIRLYAELGMGLTLLDKPLIEDGTTWNFLFSGGFGLDFKFKTPFYTFLKVEHFSNGGQLWKGFTDKRVIGPEAIVFGLGMRFPL
jgi:hypothetical protein